jgi:small subunit ribosomal protein S1
MKQLEDDPWAGVSERFPVGNEVEGTVEKVAQFGVFVNLAPGITALIPNSEMNTQRGADHRKDFPTGSPVRAAVIEVDEAGHRLTLSRKALADAGERADFQEYRERDDRSERPQRRGPVGGDRPGRGAPKRGDRPERRDGRPDREPRQDAGRPAPASPRGSGFGTLGDLFKEKLKDLDIKR